MATTKLRAAKRAWIAYRDAFLAAAFPHSDEPDAYGSAFVMEVNLLRAKLTRPHVALLRRLIGSNSPR